MKLAATPISATESTRPKIRITGCSRAAPATASTLSSDIETSAIDDLPGGLAQRLARRCRAVASIVLAARQRSRHVVRAASRAQLAPHLPADPEQQNAAGEQQADDLQQLRRDPARRRCAGPWRRTMPIRIALRALLAGSPAAARPMTMALSPASTRSIMTTWKSAVRCCEVISSSMRATPLMVQSDIAVRLNCQRGPGLDVQIETTQSDCGNVVPVTQVDPRG